MSDIPSQGGSNFNIIDHIGGIHGAEVTSQNKLKIEHSNRVDSLTESTGSVTGTSITILAANTSRKIAIITNTGSKKMWIRFSSIAATNEYLLIRPKGSFFIDSDWQYTGAVTAISVSAGTSYYVGEA